MINAYYFHISIEMNKVKETKIKNQPYYYFDNINKKDLNPNNIKIDEKSH